MSEDRKNSQELKGEVQGHESGKVPNEPETWMKVKLGERWALQKGYSCG